MEPPSGGWVRCGGGRQRGVSVLTPVCGSVWVVTTKRPAGALPRKAGLGEMEGGILPYLTGRLAAAMHTDRHGRSSKETLQDVAPRWLCVCAYGKRAGTFANIVRLGGECIHARLQGGG